MRQARGATARADPERRETRNQFMTCRIQSAGPRTIMLAASAVTLIFAMAPDAGAQQQQQQPQPQQQQQQRRPAQPAQPAKPAQQQPAPQAQPAPAQQGQDTTQLIFSPWVKLCNKDPDPNSKRVCVTVKDGRVESGLL